MDSGFKNKKIRVFMRVDPEVKQFMVNTPVMVPEERPFLDFLLQNTRVVTKDVTKPFAAGVLNQLDKLVAPLFVYYIRRNGGRHTVAVHDFIGFGEITIHPTNGHLVVAVDYSVANDFVYPLHEAVDAVRVNLSHTGREVVIEFISAENPTTLVRAYQGEWPHERATLELESVLKDLEKSA